MTEPDGLKSRINVHLGNSLARYADQYNSLMRTLVETVQNAIDANAKLVIICIDQHERTVIVADDGDGVTYEEFTEALASIAETRKSGNKGKDKIGQFGIGVISPLTKCRYFEFISVKRRRGAKPRRWRFELEELINQRSDGEVDAEPIEVMPAIEGPFAQHAASLGTTWRTMVRMFDITEDKMVSRVDLEDLEYQIQSNLGFHLRRTDVMCRVVLRNSRRALSTRDIKPREYAGEPLGTFEIENDLVGKVTLELYKTRSRGDRSAADLGVSEAHKIYPVPWKDVATQAKSLDRRAWADSEIFNVFGSGYFKGLICGEKLSLVLDRNRFKGDDALKGLIIALDTWYQETGHALYQEERDREIDERYQKISHQAMESVRERVLSRPEFRYLQDRIRQSLSIGRIGEGHADVADPIGTDEQGTMRAGSGGAYQKREPKSKPSGPKNKDPKTRDSDVPTGAVGPRGRRRTQVQNDSLGIWFSVTDFEFNPRLWEIDRATGELAFNSNHAIWMELDGSLESQRSAKHDRQIQMLQEWVAMKVIQLLPLTENEFEAGRDQADEEVLLFVELFIKRPTK